MNPRNKRILWTAIGAWWFLTAWRASVVVAGQRYFTLFDDAMISMRFARNLARGAGLVWNPGAPPVEGFTNPIWTLWMAALHAAGIPRPYIPLLVSATSAALLITAALCVKSILENYYKTDKRTADLAAISVAALSSLTYWSIRGMEVAVIVALVMIALRALALDKPWQVVVVCALLPAARIDALMFPVMIGAYTLWNKQWGRTLLIMAATVATTAALTFFRLRYYGDPLPNTYYLKMTGVSIFARASRGLKVVAIEGAPQLLFAIALLALAARNIKDRLSIFIATIIASQFAYTIYIGGDAWGTSVLLSRFLSTATPFVVLLVFATYTAIPTTTMTAAFIVAWSVKALIGAVPLIQGKSYIPLFFGHMNPLRLGSAGLLLLSIAAVIAFNRRISRWADANKTVFLTVALWLTMSAGGFSNWVFRGYERDDRVMTKTGVELGDVAKGKTIGVVWAGAVSYWSDLFAYDILGKSDRRIAHMQSVGKFKPGHSKYDLDFSLGEEKPDIIPASTAGDFDPAAQRHGYVKISNGFYVRLAANLDTLKLRRVTSFANSPP